MIDVTIHKRFGTEFLTEEEAKTLTTQQIAEKLVAYYRDNNAKFIDGADWNIELTDATEVVN